ncbi:site-specific tyrosine recombinase XerD [Jonesiaceae bacterium BS-20]|uniref:Tyrosine recombinase XerC n=1 Tax=Jonesiaceae bacterium BS-20 TaxID=3120821 RepID=A0AAU7DZQ7_9MICO
MGKNDGDLQALTRGFLNHLRVERGRSANTIAAYRRDLVRYSQYLLAQNLAFADVDEAVIDAFMTDVRTPTEDRPALATSSATRLLATIRGLHSFAAAEGITLENAAKDLKPPRVAQRLPKVLTVSQVEQLLDAPNKTSLAGLRDRALLEFLYSTGARVSEAVSLDLDDLVLDSDYPHARVMGKGNKERLVPLGSYAATALGDYLTRVRTAFVLAGQGTPSVFVNSRGRRLSRQSAWTIIRNSAVLAQLPGATEVTPHTLRHCFATHLLAGGADVRVVQELLGHASVTTTQLYTHVTIDALREVYLTSHPRAQ